MSLQNKIKVRQQLLALRAGISRYERSAAALSATQLFIESDLFNRCHHMAGYFAQDNEFDCNPIINAIWRAKKKCYLPILSKQHENSLEFGAYSEDTPLRLNRYNIPEPQGDQLISPDTFDLVLMPLVGFDSEGHRMGMGGGYYDRTFSFLRDTKIHKPFLLGLAYNIQKVVLLPTESWDVPMDGVLTEKNLYLF